MADSMEPPPLFENIDINKDLEDEDDVFASAIQVISFRSLLNNRALSHSRINDGITFSVSHILLNTFIAPRYYCLRFELISSIR